MFWHAPLAVRSLDWSATDLLGYLYRDAIHFVNVWFVSHAFGALGVPRRLLDPGCEQGADKDRRLIQIDIV